ncbi:MAG TPA: DUF4783 domain-containing protein [Puia sp.]|nr:DUF4783 domain-containing protein [Puia sp.]
MKKVAGWAILLGSFVLFSFKTFYSIDAVTAAIRVGDVDQLSPYLDYRVDIALPDKSDTYSKTQAEMVIRDFFATNEVRNFQVKQKGESNGLEFCAGVLMTRNGNYRTTLFMKQKGDKQFLEELRFQPVQ